MSLELNLEFDFATDLKTLMKEKSVPPIEREFNSQEELDFCEWSEVFIEDIVKELNHENSLGICKYVDEDQVYKCIENYLIETVQKYNKELEIPTWEEFIDDECPDIDLIDEIDIDDIRESCTYVDDDGEEELDEEEFYESVDERIDHLVDFYYSGLEEKYLEEYANFKNDTDVWENYGIYNMSAEEIEEILAYELEELLNPNYMSKEEIESTVTEIKEALLKLEPTTDDFSVDLGATEIDTESEGLWQYCHNSDGWDEAFENFSKYVLANKLSYYMKEGYINREFVCEPDNLKFYHEFVDKVTEAYDEYVYNEISECNDVLKKIWDESVNNIDKFIIDDIKDYYEYEIDFDEPDALSEAIERFLGEDIESISKILGIDNKLIDEIPEFYEDYQNDIIDDTMDKYFKEWEAEVKKMKKEMKQSKSKKKSLDLDMGR